MSIKRFFLATSAIALLSPFTAIAQTAAPTPAPAVAPAAAVPTTPPVVATAPATVTNPVTATGTAVVTNPVTATGTATAPAPAAPASTIVDPKSPVTHAEFSALVREALLKDPEIIVDAIKGLHDKQQASSAKELEKAIDKYHDELFNDTASPSIGDPKTADVTLVEFFDYHCGYCKRMLPAITQLNKEDPKVHIIFREFPILSEDSSTAAYAAIAVYHLFPEKYFAFHTALMNSSGKFDDKSLSEIAKKQGLDWKKIKKEMDAPGTKALVDRTHLIAEELGIRGTPALVIGKQMLPGAVPYEDLKKIVDSTRSGKDAKVDAKPEASHETGVKPAN